ncbi:MAG: amidohydrolase family protein [Alphaproteobacteria bacterium]
MRFLDSHHHLWDLERHTYPWLQGPPVKAHFGEYDAIRRTYDLSDYARDTAAVELVSSVHVEAAITVGERLEESHWLQDLYESTGLPGAVVAAASLDKDDLSEMLTAQSEFPIVRGVRDMLFPPGAPNRAENLASSRLFDPAWRSGFSMLSQFGMSFDLQAPPFAMTDAARLVAEHDDVPVVLTHLGPPFDRSDEGRKIWRQGIRILADVPHVCAKISGLPMTDWNWSKDTLRPWVLEAIDVFGPDRCMFGSNFPVDRLFGSFGDLIGAYWRIVEGFSDDERHAMFVGNAARFYRIPA